jgi:uncharacterized protein (DUF58 family)
MPGPPATAPERLLRRLEWHVVRRLHGRLQGSYRTVFRGSGIDFADLRPYTVEDDVRHIDWNVTARMDEPYVRQYLQDRELTAWLVLDLSASMAYGREGQGKDDVLACLAVTLARLFSHGGNRVGAILYDNGLRRVVPPGTGRAHVLRLAHWLTTPAEAPQARRSTDLAAMVHLAASTIRRRGLVFVISDFIGEGDWPSALVRLAQRHEVVAIRVVDPTEREIPDLGLVLVEDAETGEQLFVDTSDPLFQQRFREQVAAREEELASSMSHAGITGHEVATDDDLTRSIIAMADRSRGRRR